MAAKEVEKQQQRRCERCTDETEYSMLLPCQHISCQRCIEIIAWEASRTHGLSCPFAGCNSKFAIVLPPEPTCSPRPIVQPPFVRDSYAADIRLRAVVRKPRGGRKIMGIAQLEKSLYVVSREGFLDEYNVDDVEQITGPQSHPLAELRWPRGLAVSRRLGVVYITDWKRLFGGALLRFAASSHAAQSGVTKVSLDVQPFGVSVSEAEGVDVSIFVTVATPITGSSQQIVEYRDSGSDLQKVRILELPGHFQIPRHAVLMESDVFAVCHGWTVGRHHRVSKMSSTDNVLTEVAAYGTYGDEIQRLRCPLSLCIDEDGLLLVVDYNNHRIHLLTHHLQLVRHLVTKRDGIEDPRHVCLDSSRGLLYVGLQSGEIHVFQVR